MLSQSDQLVLLTFGRKLRGLRLKKSLSQEELASRACVHRTYIGMIERGEKNVTILTMVKLADALDLNVVELLGDFDLGK